MGTTALDLVRSARGQAFLPVRSGLARLDDARDASVCELAAQRRREALRGQPQQTPKVDLSFVRDVVEVTGDSGSGKTELAMSWAVNCMLPARLGGEDGTVIWFDSERRFCAERMAQIIRERIERASKEEEESGPTAEIIPTCVLEEIHAACLSKKLIIFRCSSSSQLLSTLSSLTREELVANNVKMLVFDCISSFYWRDLQVEPVTTGLHIHVPLAIRDLINRYPTTILALKSALMQPRGKVLCPEYLSQTWHRLVSLRLFTEASGGARFRLVNTETDEVLLHFCINADGVKTAN